MDCFVSVYRYVADACKSGNELSGSIKCRKYLGWLRNHQLLKKNSAPRIYIFMVIFRRLLYLGKIHIYINSYITGKFRFT